MDTRPGSLWHRIRFAVVGIVRLNRRCALLMASLVLAVDAIWRRMPCGGARYLHSMGNKWLRAGGESSQPQAGMRRVRGQTGVPTSAELPKSAAGLSPARNLCKLPSEDRLPLFLPRSIMPVGRRMRSTEATAADATAKDLGRRRLRICSRRLSAQCRHSSCLMRRWRVGPSYIPSAALRRRTRRSRPLPMRPLADAHRRITAGITTLRPSTSRIIRTAESEPGRRLRPICTPGMASRISGPSGTGTPCRRSCRRR